MPSKRGAVPLPRVHPRRQPRQPRFHHCLREYPGKSRDEQKADGTPEEVRGASGTGSAFVTVRCLKSHHLELDDCLITATCVVNKATLITGNIKHYPMQGIEKKEVSVPS